MQALITEEFHPCLVQSLEEMGYICEQNWEIDSEGVSRVIHDYELIVVNSKIKIDKNLLDKATKLKAIARIGSGLEIIDIEECRLRKITVISTPQGNANAVAEHVLGFILSAFNNLQKSQNDILSGKWLREENRGTELSGKTIAIIGCGHNGSRLVNILSGFDTEVLIYDIIDIRSRIANKNARQTTMDEIYQQADIVSFHLPLTADTRYLVSDEYIERFQKNIYFVNASRGQIVAMDTIYKGLASDKIIRAMIDVYESEPFQLNELARKYIEEYRLIVTPHIAGWTNESKRKMAEIVISSLKKLN